MDTDTCKHCGSPIKWAVNEKRQRVAVEMAPGGTLILLPPDHSIGYLLPRIADIARYAPTGRIPRTPTYRKHREVCTARGRK